MSHGRGLVSFHQPSWFLMISGGDLSKVRPALSIAIRMALRCQVRVERLPFLPLVLLLGDIFHVWVGSRHFEPADTASGNTLSCGPSLAPSCGAAPAKMLALIEHRTARFSQNARLRIELIQEDIAHA